MLEAPFGTNLNLVVVAVPVNRPFLKAVLIRPNAGHQFISNDTSVSRPTHVTILLINMEFLQAGRLVFP